MRYTAHAQLSITLPWPGSARQGLASASWARIRSGSRSAPEGRPADLQQARGVQLDGALRAGLDAHGPESGGPACSPLPVTAKLLTRGGIDCRTRAKTNLLAWTPSSEMEQRCLGEAADAGCWAGSRMAGRQGGAQVSHARQGS